MDFYKIREESSKDGSLKIYPGFRVARSKDLMVLAKNFYAIWDDAKGMWSTDEYDVQRLVDEDLLRYVEERKKTFEGHIKVHLMANFDSNSWKDFRNFLKHLSDSAHQLDEKLAFANTELKKTDYATRRLPYPLEEGECPAYEEIASTLYDPEERAKLEWAIGAVVAGDARNIQKFLVFYGDPGSGKGTILNIIMKLFKGYYATFEAKALVSAGNAFATEAFKSNPLVAIQHDGDLSKIEDNSKFNSIISHEEIMINEKFKPSYMSRVDSFCFMGTNNPVKITNAKSGIIRRLIDVHPSNRLIDTARYHVLMSQVDFELGAIAAHCLKVYRGMGKDYYAKYRPMEMMLYTDVFYNFIEAHYDLFKEQDGTTLKQAYELYKLWAADTNVEFKLPQFKFRDELKNYFGKFEERACVNNERVRSYYSEFRDSKFTSAVAETKTYPLVMEDTASLFDALMADQPAQYSKWNDLSRSEIPIKRWVDVETTLKDVDTSKTHYVKVPKDHIVIDFDLKDENGEKSAELNIAAASLWPPTYTEYSQGGAGVHLHYNWRGVDVEELSRVYDEGIEVKVFTGDSSLRRRLSSCNNVPVAELTSGLPLREKKKMFNQEGFKSELALRDLIMRNVRKEIHPGTKPSIDFISHLLDQAFASGKPYDVFNLRGKILAFANNSSNSPEYCVKQVLKMKFASDVPPELAPNQTMPSGHPEMFDTRLVFFDVEVFPNLFMVCWKYEGASNSVVTMLNPTPVEIEALLKMRLVGFNNRRYDNHMLYGALMGYDNLALYNLSQKLITKVGMFGEAYNCSYADIYDFASIKKSLKKWQLDLGIHHQELGLPWDQPVDLKLIPKIAEYCGNDVVSTEVVFNDRREDFVARQILADMSGLTINNSTLQHASKIIFGDDRRPQEKFVYTDLAEEFPGYKFEWGKSSYKFVDLIGEGGRVFAKPGMYVNVTCLDVVSMHPTSIQILNVFGEYTEKFNEIKEARVAIKRKDLALARTMLGGKLAKYIDDPNTNLADLAYALKIVINIVYGLTSAKFDNPFKDPRNKDNIVAKRGALFMIDLQQAVEEQGYEVVHIKTDSIKIANADKFIIEYVMHLGKQYGYDFEVESVYEKFCLVNDAVYIAKTANDPWAHTDEADNSNGRWTATGAQFAHPYVFKTLFSHEPIVFDDLCETKTVTTALYLDYNVDTPMFEDNGPQFVGKAGSFCPMKPNAGGGILLREKDGKFSAATGTKGYLWQESEVVKNTKAEHNINMEYFNALVDAAMDNIKKFGDFEWFVGEEKNEQSAA